MINTNISLLTNDGVIIKCNGLWHEGQVYCKFEHIGKWGDKDLIEHEKLERAKENKNTYWCGFEEVYLQKRER
jgi:hypothetical protein